MIGEKIYSHIHSFAEKFTGGKSAKEFLSLIKRIMKPYNVKVNCVIDYSNSAANIITIGGFYDSDLVFGNKDIEIYFVINEKEKNDIFNLTDEDIEILICELFKTLMHEMRHRYQYEKRGYELGRQYRANVMNEDLKQEMEYYGNDDELDAYAQEAVIEEQLYGSSPTLAKYHELFYEHDEKLYNKLLKKMCKLHG